MTLTMHLRLIAQSSRQMMEWAVFQPQRGCARAMACSPLSGALSSLPGRARADP